MRSIEIKRMDVIMLHFTLAMGCKIMIINAKRLQESGTNIIW
jgi:hypothetical protein